jgi:hypothetical protein
MIEYLAPNLVKIYQALLQCSPYSFADSNVTEKYVREKLALVHREAAALGLRSTMKGAWRVDAALAANDRAQFDSALNGALERFWEDIGDIMFLHLPPEKRDYYQKTNLFGAAFKENFPAANAQIIEAGNCFAFDRFTACAYHLARATEIALRVVFVSLGLPPRVWSVTKWHDITRRIGGKIEKNNVRLANDATWHSERPFYEKVHAFLEAARNPLRNSTMHVDVTYPDEGSIRPVWLATEAFMRHIATRLKE